MSDSNPGPTSAALAHFAQPIGDLLGPAAVGARLSPARAADLDARLQELDSARRMAWVASRFYVVGATGGGAR